MKKHDVFPSKFLSADNLNGKPCVVVIERAPLETLKNSDGKEQAKTVLSSVDRRALLPLNLTNWVACTKSAAPIQRTRPDHRIELYPTKTQMGAKTVDCIRIPRSRGRGELPRKQNVTPAEELPPINVPPTQRSRSLSQPCSASPLALARQKDGRVSVPAARQAASNINHGCKDATNELAAIEKWWEENPEYNIAVATGAPSNIFPLLISTA